jgi:hypothetical protein
MIATNKTGPAGADVEPGAGSTDARRRAARDHSAHVGHDGVEQPRRPRGRGNADLGVRAGTQAEGEHVPSFALVLPFAQFVASSCIVLRAAQLLGLGRIVNRRQLWGCPRP